MELAKEERARASRAGIVAVAGALVLGAALRLHDLDRLPGEIYGDISLLITLIDEIVAGGSPRFLLSAGPLYPLLVAPIVAVAGHSYLVLKLLTGACGLATAAATGWLAREVADGREAVVATFVAAVSSWLLVFSRLGNLQVLSPLLVAVALAFSFRAVRTGSAVPWLAATVVSIGGLFCYPSTFVLPFLVLALQGLTLRGRGSRGLAVLAISTVAVAAGAAGSFRMLAAAGEGPGGGYVLGHALAPGTSLAAAAATLAQNLASGLGMLHVRGDEVFRSNPPGRPHLDPLSGICCLVGLVVFLRRPRGRTGLLLIASYLVLLMPSVLVLAAPREVPSASRALGVVPIVYLWVASGAVAAGAVIERYAGALASRGVLALLLGAIAVWNARIYFEDYVRDLPNGNVAFGREVAAAIDDLPDGVHARVLGCCWGAWGQPEPEGIRHALERPRSFGHTPADPFDCERLRARRPVAVFLDPRAHDRIAAVEGCLQAKATIKRVADVDVFAAVVSRRQP